MAGDNLPQGEVIGIVIGAIVLFGIISIVPIIIMFLHRRRAANRAANETHNRTSPMQQTCVEQWLEEQNVSSDIERYAHDTWYVVNLFHRFATSRIYVGPSLDAVLARKSRMM
ncbi:uncharacterized protein N7482_005090 [Penicillium canariense]|uniref:Uncharacterized protein n=1 Tax=Penicillium canariense TaxID=189055 RepID=A0A9W9I4B4_9EURO|nr:uncharacterized protein N7482_005090 [Penicillium canariense]KAJ5166309.1 hypothetical protein N7482_005090 [Penicillium canariense]